MSETDRQAERLMAKARLVFGAQNQTPSQIITTTVGAYFQGLLDAGLNVELATELTKDMHARLWDVVVHG